MPGLFLEQFAKFAEAVGWATVYVDKGYCDNLEYLVRREYVAVLSLVKQISRLCYT